MKDIIKFFLGAIAYIFTKKTPKFGYFGMLNLFCKSGGKTNDCASTIVGMVHPKIKFPTNEGILGNLNQQKLTKIKNDLDENGFHIFENKLPSEVCDKLLQHALSNECNVYALDGNEWDNKSVIVDPNNPIAVRYVWGQKRTVNIPTVQDLLADYSLLSVAQEYLGARPLLDVTDFWWHFRIKEEADDNAAQLYHFDLDRLKWLKFFIYIKDVGPNDGPHCFVKGSHKTGAIPKKFLQRGYARLTDQEVEESFGKENIIEYVGTKGTIIAEDTRGLHKGKLVGEGGDRLILQIQFSNSLFGTNYENVKFDEIKSPMLNERIKKYPHCYRNFIN